MSFLKIWFLVTGAVLGALMIWAFVPILVPAIAVAVGLGGVVWAMVALARSIERSRGGQASSGDGRSD